MALTAYLKLTGKIQGEIKGSVIQKGREGKIAVIAANHQLVSPYNEASGQASGKRMHKPFVITKELDKSSPLLYNLLINNENITSWELQFWTPAVGAATGAGAEKQHYTIRLTNARLVDIRFVMPNNKNPDLQKLTEYEELSFVYQKIEWTWNDGGIMAADQPFNNI